VLLRAFCQWKTEYQLRKCCVKGLILRNMVGRERDAGRLYESGYKQYSSQPKILGRVKYFDFKVATVFCSGHCLSKQKMTRYGRTLGNHGPLDYACG